MVDTSLNRKYEAKEGKNMDFSPIPEGMYKVRVKEISDWEEKNQKNVKVYQKDEDGSYLVDDKGERITETIEDCTFYECNVRFEVIGGDYAGRLVFHKLTTHPNRDFTIQNFLYGVDEKELEASDIQKECIGLECEISVYIDEYTKTVQNKETGLDEEVSKKVNRISYIKKSTTNPTENDEELDLGI